MGSTMVMTPERAKLMLAVHDLTDKLLEVVKEHDMPTAILAIETALAHRAVAGDMPLQELMDNLLANIPQMYTIFTEPEKEVGVA
jgi:hypothetical protein